MRKLKTLALRLSLLAAAILAALWVGELVLRLRYLGSLESPESYHGLWAAHPTRGWALRPGASSQPRTLDYQTRVDTNSKGWRDVEHEYAKPAGTFRIVVLGDSFMEAHQVELEESFCRRLERELGGGAEVVNLGVGGYGTIQAYLALAEEGLRYEPDLVLLAFMAGNDLRNNHPVLERLISEGETIKTFGRPYLASDPGDYEGEIRVTPLDLERVENRVRRRRAVPFWRETLLFELGQMQWQSLGRPYDPNVWLGPYLADFTPTAESDEPTREDFRRMWREAWQITARAIVGIDRLAERHGARFLLFTVPERIQVDATYRAFLGRLYPGLELETLRVNRALAELAETHGLRFLDLVPAFQRSVDSGAGPLHFQMRDRHWNAAGHRLAAREVAAHLGAERLRPSPQGAGRRPAETTYGSSRAGSPSRL